MSNFLVWKLNELARKEFFLKLTVSEHIVDVNNRFFHFVIVFRAWEWVG